MAMSYVYIQLNQKLKIMKKFEKQSLVWFVIYLVVLGAVIFSTSSCTATRQNGCYNTRGLVGYK